MKLLIARSPLCLFIITPASGLLTNKLGLYFTLHTTFDADSERLRVMMRWNPRMIDICRWRIGGRKEIWSHQMQQPNWHVCFFLTISPKRAKNGLKLGLNNWRPCQAGFTIFLGNYFASHLPERRPMLCKTRYFLRCHDALLTVVLLGSTSWASCFAFTPHFWSTHALSVSRIPLITTLLHYCPTLPQLYQWDAWEEWCRHTSSYHRWWWLLLHFHLAILLSEGMQVNISWLEQAHPELTSTLFASYFSSCSLFRKGVVSKSVIMSTTNIRWAQVVFGHSFLSGIP